jgi:hypothetical protein
MARSPKEVAVFPEQEKILLVCVNKVYKTINMYDAVRYSWPVKPEKAQEAKYVMAVFRGVIVGVFEADEWFPALKIHFPHLSPEHANWHKQEGRFGFIGSSASKDVELLYLDKYVPKQWRFTGNSIRYVNFR